MKNILFLVFLAYISFYAGCSHDNISTKETNNSEVQGSSITDQMSSEASFNQSSENENQIDFISGIDLDIISPLEFLELLAKNPHAVYSPLNGLRREGWIKYKDVQKLIEYVESNVPCAKVVSPICSHIPEGNSTVGTEAMFLIEGYLKGGYPPALDSGSFEKKEPKWYKNELENYWKDRLNERCSVVYLRSLKGSQLQLLELSRYSSTNFGIQRVYDQYELEKTVQAIDKKVCLWIDIEAVNGLNKEWLLKKAVEEKYPVLLIGNGNALYSFRDILGIGRNIIGPQVQEEDRRKEGFSAYLMLNVEDKDGLKESSILKGLPGEVKVADLEAVSKILLNGGGVFFECDDSDTGKALRCKFWNVKSSVESSHIQDVVQSLEGVDWSEIYRLSRDDCFSIMNWFAEQAKSGNEQALKALMSNRKGLDGAIAENYSWQIGDILASKTDTFIKTLSGLDESDIDDILKFINHEIEGRKELSKKLDAFLKGASLDEKEESIVKRLLGFRIVNVKTVNEFLEAVGPQKIIKLSPGIYQLGDIPDEYKGNEYVTVRQGNLVIHDVEDLTIKGLIEQPAEVVTSRQTANVITFEKSMNISIDNLKLGHWPASGGCSGGVAVFDSCRGIAINNSMLFGCGINGLELCNTSEVYFKNSKITDCSMYIMFLSKSEKINFTDSSFSKNDGTELININSCEHVIFDKCTFADNKAGSDTAAFFVIDCAYSPYVHWEEHEGISDVKVMNSTFANNAISSEQLLRTPDKSSERLTFENTVFEGNSFDEMSELRK